MTKASPQPEFVTILAPTAEAALREFRRQGLGEQGYLIAARMARHRFSMAGDDARSLDDLSDMVVATFCRA